MAREAMVKRAEARRAAKAPAKRTVTIMTTRHVENAAIAAVILAAVAGASYKLAYDGLARQYERAIESTVRIVAANVETCVRSGRTLERTSVAPLCRDPNSGTVAPTDREEGLPPAAPAKPVQTGKTKPKTDPTDASARRRRLPALVEMAARPKRDALGSAMHAPAPFRPVGR